MMLSDPHAPENSPEQVQSLIQQAIAGDQTAFSVLYQGYASTVYRMCFGVLLHTEDAEDVTQEAFVYAFRNLTRFDATRSSFKTWLYTIALSRCRNLYRRHVVPSLNVLQLLLDIPAPHSETPEAHLTRRQASDEITRAMASLTPSLREAIVLRYAQGLSYREIAEVMNCPTKTAESRVRLGHKHLHQVLQPQGRSLLEELLWSAG